MRVVTLFHDGQPEEVRNISNVLVIDTKDLWLFEAPGSKPVRVYLPGEWAAFLTFSEREPR